MTVLSAVLRSSSHSHLKPLLPPEPQIAFASTLFRSCEHAERLNVQLSSFGLVMAKEWKPTPVPWQPQYDYSFTAQGQFGNLSCSPADVLLSAVSGTVPFEEGTLAHTDL